jgi:hypothetical protein
MLLHSEAKNREMWREREGERVSEFERKMTKWSEAENKMENIFSPHTAFFSSASGKGKRKNNKNNKIAEIVRS